MSRLWTNAVCRRGPDIPDALSIPSRVAFAEGADVCGPQSRYLGACRAVGTRPGSPDSANLSRQYTAGLRQTDQPVAQHAQQEGKTDGCTGSTFTVQFGLIIYTYGDEKGMTLYSKAA